MSFNELGLPEAILRAVAHLGHESPTPIQRKAVPIALAGGDLLAAAQTGTGKTAAFAMPTLARLGARGAHGAPPRALVLTPTRELAAQVAASFRDYGRHLPLQTEAVYGGVGMFPQTRALRRGVDVLVATPGRLIDHLEQRTARLSNVEVLVLDEADRMLDMGFLPAIRRIIAMLPANRQNLLFSATFSAGVRRLAATLLRNPAEIDVAPRNSAAATVTQRAFHVDKDNKRPLLVHLLRTGGWGQTLVFARTKHGAERLSDQLEREGILAAAIHGDKSQGQRTRALDQFKQGRVRVLVATDVAARGIDVDGLTHVVNFDLPNSPEDYVHRIGRTGRAGASGEAISLVSSEERAQLKDIEHLLGRTLSAATIAGYEPTHPAVSGSQSQPAGVRRRHTPGVNPAGHHGHRRDAGGGRTHGRAHTPARKGR
ncbi:MAG: ATP-dependent RNA helicase RhlE [Gammaproteobacteria bacterium]|nr:ATP-dependent RNA helicase RhlE [Gammaproteobacteria bacterium]